MGTALVAFLVLLGCSANVDSVWMALLLQGFGVWIMGERSLADQERVKLGAEHQKLKGENQWLRRSLESASREDSRRPARQPKTREWKKERVRLTGLWQEEGKDGSCHLAGSLRASGIARLCSAVYPASRLLIFRQTEKKHEKSADYVAYLVPPEKSEPALGFGKWSKQQDNVNE